MKSLIFIKIEEILGPAVSAGCYVDKRKNGYRLKYTYFNANLEQIERIKTLPHIIKAANKDRDFIVNLNCMPSLACL